MEGSKALPILAGVAGGLAFGVAVGAAFARQQPRVAEVDAQLRPRSAAPTTPGQPPKLKASRSTVDLWQRGIAEEDEAGEGDSFSPAVPVGDDFTTPAAGGGAARRSLAGSASASRAGSLPWNKHGTIKHFELGEFDVCEGMAIHVVRRLRVPLLNELFPEQDAKVSNERRHLTDCLGEKISYENLISGDYAIIGDIVRRDTMQPVSRAYVRAGPRPSLFFEPSGVRAAIVTCGGLCPGLNDVIRELVRTLHILYGVDKVLGVRGGYGGFARDPVELTVDSVADIHRQGGTALGSDRGGFDAETVLSFCRTHRVSQVYVIGGDGSHRGANAIFKAAVEQAKLPLSVVGIPKTIDDDIDMIDRSFGFVTAVEEARKAVQSAKVEARCAPNGIGIVKVMGRNAGFIAAHATLASGDVDVCLVPEVPTVLEGRRGVFGHLERVLAGQGHAVVVVAEGAGADLLREQTPDERDAGGNRKLPPIGPFLKGAIAKHFADKGEAVNIKYIDPSYIIRSVPANASDAVYCMLLAQSAVHGAMAGFTGFSVGLVNNRLVYLPITAIVANSPRVMNPLGRTWERIISVTRQPNNAKALKRGETALEFGTVTGRTIY